MEFGSYISDNGKPLKSLKEGNDMIWFDDSQLSSLVFVLFKKYIKVYSVGSDGLFFPSHIFVFLLHYIQLSLIKTHLGKLFNL